jgi:hypothetical protein
MDDLNIKNYDLNQIAEFMPGSLVNIKAKMKDGALQIEAPDKNCDNSLTMT